MTEAETWRHKAREWTLLAVSADFALSRILLNLAAEAEDIVSIRERRTFNTSSPTR